jgi:hypothetical protein
MLLQYLTIYRVCFILFGACLAGEAAVAWASTRRLWAMTPQPTQRSIAAVPW